MSAEYYTTPLPTAVPMRTAIANPTRVSTHIMAGGNDMGNDDWQHQLIDCCSDKGCFSDNCLCLQTFCCAPCAYGQLVNRIKTGYPGDFCGDTGACASFLGLSFIPYVGGLVAAAYSAQTRTEIRTAYRLPETPCNDVCVHVCCLPWALFQETKEVTARQRDGQGVPVSPRYAVQPMTAAPTQGVSMARS